MSIRKVKRVAILEDHPDWVLDFAQRFNQEYNGHARIGDIWYLPDPEADDDTYEVVIREAGFTPHRIDAFSLQWLEFDKILKACDILLMDYDIGYSDSSAVHFLSEELWNGASVEDRRKIFVYTSIDNYAPSVATAFGDKAVPAHREPGSTETKVYVEGNTRLKDLCMV